MATRVHYNPEEPGISQVYKMGKSYGPWSYKPLAGFGTDQSIMIIGGSLEALTHVPVWTPVLWGAVAIALFSYTCVNSGVFFAGWTFLCGLLAMFPLIEYIIHRWVFHMSTESGYGIINVFHFLLHGIHHKTPNDTTRLLAPVPLIVVLVIPVHLGMIMIFSTELTLALWAGIFVGYVQYDYTHLYLHTKGHRPAWIRPLVKQHQNHHRHHHHKFFGISYLSNLIWDRILRTQ